MPVKRFVIALVLVLAALGAAGASAQVPGDLSYLKTYAGTHELITRTLLVPGPLPGNLAVQAAEQKLVQLGYLTAADAQNFGPDVSITSSGITITYHVPGGPDIVVVLPNGPFLPIPTPAQRVMSIIVVRDISNGF